MILQVPPQRRPVGCLRLDCYRGLGQQYRCQCLWSGGFSRGEGVHRVEQHLEVQVNKLAEALDGANDRLAEQEDELRQTQHVHLQEEQRMAQEIQELAAITEHLRWVRLSLEALCGNALPWLQAPFLLRPPLRSPLVLPAAMTNS